MWRTEKVVAPCKDQSSARLYYIFDQLKKEINNQSKFFSAFIGFPLNKFLKYFHNILRTWEKKLISRAKKGFADVD